MDNSHSGKIIKVLIGQVHMTRPPNHLQAILGSCIAVVLYDPVERLSGMAHILLPDSNNRPSTTLPGKYADHAVQCLLKELPKHGAKRNRLKAKIAGGSHMFSKSLQQNSINDVGGLNIASVRELLSAAGIAIASSDVGGAQGRKVEFNPHTFEFLIEDFAERRQII